MDGWRVNVQYEPIVFQYDSPLALELLLHAQFGHDLSRLHGHPVLDGVCLSVLEPRTTNVAHDYFFLFNAQPAHVLRCRVKLGMEYHTSFLVIIVSQLMLRQSAVRTPPIVIVLLVHVVRASDQVRLLVT